MRYESIERRTEQELRSRFEELKAECAQQLGRVSQRMPQPWFEELVDDIARLKVRCEKSAGVYEEPGRSGG